MRYTFAAGFVVLLLLVGAPQAAAQERWSADLQGGPAFTTKDFGDAELSSGLGLDATISYRLQKHLWIYGGWGYHHFNTENSFAGADIDVEETGYLLGLRYQHPMCFSPAALYIRAGATLNHVELEDNEGELVSDSEHGVGWEAGAGVSIPVGSRWSITPGVRFRSLSRDIEIGTATTPVDLNYVSVEAGVSYLF
ncbi:MAG TPA: porin family protein [Candidatus Sabulitectum sp.]|nr:porin family protein [Candidatus Sabulitectum sp.]HPJ28807.1 porin family protein [Candidatus Sabulitectum sp.]HPR23211.1 porin family protein [Candidatus Sabulitectum sp.]